MAITPGEGQQQLFESPEAPQVNEEQRAILHGIEVATQFMKDPDSFGADWPSAQFNRAYREQVAATTPEPGTQSENDEKQLTEREKVILATKRLRASRPEPTQSHLDKLIDIRRRRHGA